MMETTEQVQAWIREIASSLADSLEVRAQVKDVGGLSIPVDGNTKSIVRLSCEVAMEALVRRLEKESV